MSQRQDKAALIARIPPEALRVQVTDLKGKIKYRAPSEVRDTDEIQVDKDGTPICMTTKPGRPKGAKTLERMASKPANEVVGEIIRRREEAVRNDPILTVARANPESPDVLHQIMLALAEEAAGIEFDRKEAEKAGDETAGISNRRITSLKAIGDTWLKRKEQIAARGIELDSPAFHAVFAYIMETFRDALASCEVKPELVETVFSKFAKTIGDDNWEAEARNRMKNIV